MILADWFKSTDEMMKFYLEKEDVEDVRIEAPAGSMVFWDSRTVHYGCRPGKYTHLIFSIPPILNYKKHIKMLLNFFYYTI